MAEQSRDVTGTYVAGTGQPVPGVYAFSGEDASIGVGDVQVADGPLALGVNAVGFAVQDGEAEVDVSIEDAGASANPAMGPVCAHYTFYGDDGPLQNGVFEGETSLSLPAGADKVTISVGHSHDPGALGLGLTDCADQKGTAGEIHASFS